MPLYPVLLHNVREGGGAPEGGGGQGDHRRVRAPRLHHPTLLQTIRNGPQVYIHYTVYVHEYTYNMYCIGLDWEMVVLVLVKMEVLSEMVVLGLVKMVELVLRKLLKNKINVYMIKRLRYV